MKTPIIQTHNIVREFELGEQTVRVLHGINLTLYQGEMVAIIGQSGSGKSTLMNILGCLDTPTAGDYIINGQNVSQMDSQALAKLRREHFGFIFQKYHLLGDINAMDNVAIPAVYKGVPQAVREKRAIHLLSNLGLSDKIHNRPNQLSGGQQQRVSIARALMNGGEIILADEPTGALDSRSGKEVMAILHDLKDKGHTIIMVTHDPNLALQAQRVIELKDGVVIKDYYNTDSQTFDNQNTNTSSSPVNIAIRTDTLSNPVLSTKSTPQNQSIWISFFDRLTESLKMSLYAMKAHKMRTLLTMLGIIIGIASVVSMVGLGQGSQAKILADISSLGANTITVIDGYPWGDPRRKFGYDNLSIDDARAISLEPYAKSVSPQVDTTVTARFGNIESSASINGVGFDYLTATGEKLHHGTHFNAKSVDTLAQDVIIDNNAYQTFFNGQGDPIGQTLMLGSLPARITGVLAKKDGGFGRANNTPQFYMPYTTVMHRMLGSSNLDHFVVVLNDSVSADFAESAIRKLMTARHGTDDFDIMNSDAIRKTVESTTGALTLFISSIAIISLIVGGIGVMNIMLVSVTERTSEIGVRMAVGARQSDIMGQFLIEAILVCVLGGLIGIGLSFLIGMIINAVGGENFGFIYSPLSVFTAFTCSTLIGVVFGFLPAKNAARLDPVEALSRQ